MEIIIFKSNKSVLRDQEDMSLSEAIYTLYKNEDSPVIKIIWNRQDLFIDGITLSHLINDLSRMVYLLKQGKDNFSIHFLDNAFTAKWDCALEGEILKIESLWTIVKGFSADNGSLKNLRELKSELISKTVFLESMQILFTSIKEKLITAGYNKSIEDFELLDV